MTTTVEAPSSRRFTRPAPCRPEREYSIRSNVAGLIVKMLVDKGDRVTRGDPLAVVMSDDIELKSSSRPVQNSTKKERLADEKTSPTPQGDDANLCVFRDARDLTVRPNA